MTESKIVSEGDKVTLSLFGEVDHHSARAIREACDKELLLRTPRRLVLDFSGVSFMDSSGIGLIIGRADLAESIGCCVIVSGLSDMLLRLVRMSGVEKIKNITLRQGL